MCPASYTFDKQPTARAFIWKQQIMCALFSSSLELGHVIAANISKTDVDKERAPPLVRPSRGAPILIRNPVSGRTECLPARFGLVPSWYRGGLKGWKVSSFNAQIETASEKRVFSGAWKYRHALIPATSFFKADKSGRKPKAVQITRSDNHPLVFAGLWEEAYLNEGELWSFAILTRPAGPDIASLEDREPVALRPEDWSKWLQGSDTDLRQPTGFKLTPMNFLVDQDVFAKV